MKGFFKKYFIPHEENGHKPHILRLEKILLLTSAALALELVFLVGQLFIIPRTSFLASVFPNVLIDQTNESRTSEHIASLAPNSLLEKAAQMKADDMAQKGYFAHTSPEGVTPWYWLEEVGYGFSYAGENLAVNFTDSKDVVNAWLASPLHRANILNGKFTEIGIATARGMYEGHEATFVVQFFGKPSLPIVAGGEKTTASPPASAPSESAMLSPVMEASPETFVAVAGAETEAEPNPTALSESGTSQKMLPQSSGLEKALAAPNLTIAYVYVIFGAVILVALFLKVFVKIHIQYPALVFNGLVFIILITGIVFLNRYIALLHAQVF